MENKNDNIGLVEKGYVKMIIDENGIERFSITEKGKKAIESEKKGFVWLED